MKMIVKRFLVALILVLCVAKDMQAMVSGRLASGLARFGSRGHRPTAAADVEQCMKEGIWRNVGGLANRETAEVVIGPLEQVKAGVAKVLEKIGIKPAQPKKTGGLPIESVISQIKSKESSCLNEMTGLEVAGIEYFKSPQGKKALKNALAYNRRRISNARKLLAKRPNQIVSKENSVVLESEPAAEVQNTTVAPKTALIPCMNTALIPAPKNNWMIHVPQENIFQSSLLTKPVESAQSINRPAHINEFRNYFKSRYWGLQQVEEAQKRHLVEIIEKIAAQKRQAIVDRSAQLKPSEGFRDFLKRQEELIQKFDELNAVTQCDEIICSKGPSEFMQQMTENILRVQQELEMELMRRWEKLAATKKPAVPAQPAIPATETKVVDSRLFGAAGALAAAGGIAYLKKIREEQDAFRALEVLHQEQSIDEALRLHAMTLYDLKNHRDQEIDKALEQKAILQAA